MKPLLALVMIVKDEAETLGKTLASAAPFIDRWLVADTGSTDRTADVVRAALADVPGELASIPFVDFASARNAALDAASDAAEFLLVMDAEDVLSHGAELRAFLEAHRASTGQEHEAYNVTMRLGASTFTRPAILRASAGWRYKGVVHEVCVPREGGHVATIKTPAVITHDRAPQSGERTKARWERDLALLEAEAERSPRDTRTAFYLAQTLDCLAKRDRAIAAYKNRVALGGWREEVFESLLRIARVKAAAGHPWPDVQQAFLDAYEHSPHRAEPLHEVALHYYREGRWPLCYVFASGACSLPYPEHDRLFVAADVYAFGRWDLLGIASYYVGQRETGERAVRKALEQRPDDARLQKNLEFYVGQAAA